ncbi:MAG: 3-oxoacyl-[acyl-carrier-protein] synthase III C-terminal domain-containing protein [Elusimicrobia bacterium]|nr:3-oxoacyl-[acyl-carrier-protein] synthase III C-terminal domain-containing protein [Elusimicrobiota bacterium]
MRDVKSDDNMFLAGIGTAVPEFCLEQDKAFKIIEDNYSETIKPSTLKLTKKIFSHPSVAKRHFAFSDANQFLSENQDTRIDRFTAQSVELAAHAAEEALKRAKVNKKDLAAVVVNTCTGYICPGISSYLIERMGLRKDIMFYDLVGAGCAGAIPNIRLCRDIAKSNGDSPVLGVSVEISSCDFRMDDNIGIIVSNAIFADGAASYIVRNKPSGFEILDFESACLPKFREDIRFIYKEGSLYNKLSLRLPEIVGKSIAEFLEGFFAKHSLKIKDIDYWAVHPGGENILLSIEDSIAIDKKKLQYTREILKNYGNMSSPTVIFVLDNIIQNNTIKENGIVILLAFGAGFQIQAALLKKYAD